MSIPRYKVIHCLLPSGRAVEALERLRQEKGIADVFHHHARGGGISTRKGRESFHYIEREIATVLVPEERADEIFEFLYFATGVNQPHSGMVLMEKTVMARPIVLPPDMEGDGEAPGADPVP
ncbi:MAG: hypothetical protein H6935_03685 [Thiobacillus sp.]|nr:hypothetical protein [Thiobacillus sp.]